ncbi:MAG: GNAT family N-acetyltransferase [Acidisphaera sp.]|nr:GNAT family N-acetyltransferase [Acidisphaera sp.]
MLGTIADTDPDLTIFQMPWWLDAVSFGQWAAVTAGDGVNSFLWLPYAESRKLGLTVIGMPPLTHTLGPVIRLPEGRAVLRGTCRRKLIDAALAALPPHHGFFQVLDPRVEDALDYAINGMEVGVRYTFRIDTACGPDALWQSLKHNTRNVIRKAERFVRAGEMGSVMDFYAFYEANLRERGFANHHDRRLYEALSAALARRSQHKVIAAFDRHSGQPVAAALLVWDSMTLYYLRATRNPVEAGRGVGSHLLWQAISLAAEKHLIFDTDSFYGRGSALFLEAFGAKPTPRLTIDRRRRSLKLIEACERQLANARTRLLRPVPGGKSGEGSPATLVSESRSGPSP